MSFTDRQALLGVATSAVKDLSDGISQKAPLSTETTTPTTQELIKTTTPTTQGLIKTTTPTTQEFIEATTPTTQKLIKKLTTTQRLVNMTNPTTGKFAEMSTSEIGASRDSTTLSSWETTGSRTRTSSEMQTTSKPSFEGTTSAKDETTTLNTGVEGEASEPAVYTTRRQTESDQITGAAREPDTQPTYSIAQPGKPAERTTESKMVSSTSDMYELSTDAATPRSPVTTGFERDHPLGTTSTLDSLHEGQKGAKSKNFHFDKSELLHSILQNNTNLATLGQAIILRFCLC